MIIDATKPAKKNERRRNDISDVEKPQQGEGKLENTSDQNKKYAQAGSQKNKRNSSEKDQKSYRSSK